MLKDSVLAVTEQSEAVHWLCAHLLCLLLSLAPFYDNLSLSANMFTYIQTIQSNQGLRWLGHMVWTPNDRLRKKRLFTEIASHSVGGGGGGGVCLPDCPSSSVNGVVLLDCQTVALVGCTGMQRSGCSEETNPVPHVPRSSCAGNNSCA